VLKGNWTSGDYTDCAHSDPELPFRDFVSEYSARIRTAAAKFL
jgi:hypothetical protein